MKKHIWTPKKSLDKIVIVYQNTNSNQSDKYAMMLYLVLKVMLKNKNNYKLTFDIVLKIFSKNDPQPVSDTSLVTWMSGKDHISVGC